MKTISKEVLVTIVTKVLGFLVILAITLLHSCSHSTTGKPTSNRSGQTDEHPQVADKLKAERLIWFAETDKSEIRKNNKLENEL